MGRTGISKEVTCLPSKLGMQGANMAACELLLLFKVSIHLGQLAARIAGTNMLSHDKLGACAPWRQMCFVGNHAGA